MFQSTAIYPNRIEDKKEIESRLGFQEEGDPFTHFYIKKYLFARGYQRVVYGDHGPYMEFAAENIQCRLNAINGQQYDELPSEKFKYFYVWMYPDFNSNIKVYWQVKPVTYLKNAPPREDGKPHAFNRVEGYADYRRGYYYVDPFVFTPII